MSTAKDGSIEKVVEAAVQAQVQKMIVESLEGVEGLVGRLVAAAMQLQRDPLHPKAVP